MNVTLRQLRAFVQIAQSGGFTQAARKLHLTQSATSLLMRKLEDELGVQLFDRTTRKLSITAVGSEFLASAERIVAEVEQAVADTQTLLHKRRGRITIATTPLLAGALMPMVIAAFRKAYAAIDVRLVDQLPEQIVRLVHSGDADFGIGVFPASDLELQRKPLLRHSLGAMIPADWPLARRRRRLAWSDLAGQPIIAMTHSSGYRSLVDPILQHAGVAMAPQFEVGHVGTAIGLAEAGLGITVIPAYAAQLVRSNRLRFRVLSDPVVQREIEMVSRVGRSLSPGAAAFREVLAAHCERMQDARA